MTPMPEDEFDTPYGDLPTFGRIRLSQNQIVVVNAEARFAREDSALEEGDAKKIWKKLGHENFPYFEAREQNQVNLVLTDDGASQSKEVTRGWALSNAEKTVSIMLMPTFINIQILKYAGFSESLANIFSEAVDAYVSVIKPSVMQRVGIRYVNRLSDLNAKAPGFWSSRIKTGFVGPLNDSLASFVTGSHQEVQLMLTEGASAIIHSGVFQDTVNAGAFSFLVDIDVFRDYSTDYSKKVSENITRKLNRTAYAIFDQMLTPAYIQEMGVSSQNKEVAK